MYVFFLLEIIIRIFNLNSKLATIKKMKNLKKIFELKNFFKIKKTTLSLGLSVILDRLEYDS